MTLLRAAPAVRTGRGPSGGIAVLMIVGGGLLTQLLTAVTGVLSARMLGVEGRGQIVLVASLAQMISMLTLGGALPNAIIKQLAERDVTARDGLRNLVGRWVLWSLLWSSAAAGYFLFVERHSAGTAKYALAVAVLIMAIQSIVSRILIGAMLGEGSDLLHVAMTGVLPQAAVTAALVAAFAAGIRWNAVELSAVTIACIAVVLAGRLRLLRKPTGRPQDGLDRRELSALARRTYISSVGPIDGLSLDNTLVGSLLGSVKLGLYSVAFALAQLTTILGRCLAMVILPRVAVAQRDPAAERQLVRRWLAASALVIGGAVFGLELTLHWVIEIAFGTKFLAATACARWLVAASGLLDFRRVLIAVLQARARGGLASILEISLTPFVIIGIMLAAAHDSLVGVGIAMAAVGLLSCLMLGAAVARSARGTRYVPQHARPAQHMFAAARVPGGASPVQVDA